MVDDAEELDVRAAPRARACSRSDSLDGPAPTTIKVTAAAGPLVAPSIAVASTAVATFFSSDSRPT